MTSHQDNWQDRTEQIAKLIHPLPKTNRCPEIDLMHLNGQLQRWNEDYGLELDPEFQRGHVWTQEQQIAFIEGIVRGSIGSSGLTVTMNCPDYGGNPKAKDSDLDKMVCVDGLQRLTAIQHYLENRFKIFQQIDGGVSVDYFDHTAFSFKSLYIRIQIHTMQNLNDVLHYYVAVNDGGTPHSKEELNRIKARLK